MKNLFRKTGVENSSTSFVAAPKPIIFDSQRVGFSQLNLSSQAAWGDGCTIYRFKGSTSLASSTFMNVVLGPRQRVVELEMRHVGLSGQEVVLRQKSNWSPRDPQRRRQPSFQRQVTIPDLEVQIEAPTRREKTDLREVRKWLQQQIARGPAEG